MINISGVKGNNVCGALIIIIVFVVVPVADHRCNNSLKVNVSRTSELCPCCRNAL